MTNPVPFSAYGIPLLGLTGLLACLAAPQNPLSAQAAEAPQVFLVPPSLKYDKSMTIFLRRAAGNVAESRSHRTAAAQVQAIASYNLIAQECTPAVFQATHLPPAMSF